MLRTRRFSLLILLGCLALPGRCPAPLIYVPGEGWRYEMAGKEGSWARGTAKDQFEVAQESFEAKKYGRAIKAARRTVNVWPLSDYAPQAQYLLGRSLEAKGRDEKAFKAYQTMIERYPKLDNYEEIVQRQFDIANRFLAGKWFRLWGLVPLYPSMEKTVRLYEQIINNGPFSDVAPQAQMNIGQAYLNKFFPDYPSAAKAYETAADRYSNQPIGRDALYLVGDCYHKQADTAEYDQSVAAQAIATFNDFITLFPTDPRVEIARDTIIELRTEQARGNFEIARFYEKKRKWNGALIYYNEVLLNDPNSTFADEARLRIAAIKKRQEELLRRRSKSAAESATPATQG